MPACARAISRLPHLDDVSAAGALTGATFGRTMAATRERWLGEVLRTSRTFAAMTVCAGMLLAACGTSSAPGAPTATATASTGPAPATAPVTASAVATPTATASAFRPASGPAVSIAFADTHHGWALTDCGTAAAGKSPLANGVACRLAATADGGRTWTAAATGLPAGATLQFLDDRTGFASVGGGDCVQGACPGMILATTNGGATWNARYSGALALGSVDYTSPATAWGVASGALYQSTDGGATWASAQAPGGCSLDFVRFSTAENGIAGGHGSQGPCTIATRDGGASWRAVITGGADPSLRPALAAFAGTFDQVLQGAWQGGAQCAATDERLVFGGTGWLYVTCDPFNPGALAVLHTADGGATWQLAWGIQACLMGCHGDGGGQEPLFYLDGTTVWRVAPSGEARSTDGGRTWRSGGQLCRQGSGCPVSVAFVSAEDGWAVTQGGLYGTTDGGATWTQQWPAK